MRKSLFISFVCAVLFPFVFLSQAKALDIYQLDQNQTLGGGSVVVYSGYNRNQTFKVTKGILTKIEVLMKNRQGGYSVTLTVKDETNGTTIATKTQRMDDGDGWETFDLSGEEWGIVVDKSHTFSMWIGTSYFPSPAPSWEYENSDVYANGSMRDGTTPSNGDYAFKTYGWELIAILPPEEELPEDDGGDEEPADEDEEPADEEEDDEIILTPDTSSSLFSFDEDDIDDTVIVPALEFVIVNNIVVDSQKDEGVNTDDDDIVKISGTAGPGDTVAVTIGEKTYTTTADEDGNWYIVVSTLDLEAGSYTVKAQSKNEDNKVSTEVELFNLNVLGEESPVIEKDSKSDIFSYMIYGFSGLLLAGLIVLLILVIRKKKNDKKGNKVEIKTPDIEKEESKDVIEEVKQEEDNIEK